MDDPSGEALSRLARQLDRATEALQQATVQRERAEQVLVEAEARLRRKGLSYGY
jgi:hypothetical protein